VWVVTILRNYRDVRSWCTSEMDLEIPPVNT